MIDKTTLFKFIQEKKIISSEIKLTDLLYCPTKYEMRKKYPEIQKEPVYIISGFAYETLTLELIKIQYEGKLILNNPELTYDNGSVKIVFHPDILVIDNQNKEIIHYEVKKMNFLKDVNNLPSQYIEQVKAYRFILYKLYPDYQVNSYLIIWTNRSNGTGKIYNDLVQIQIKEQWNEYDLLTYYENFKKDKLPRFEWECSYCEFQLICPIFNSDKVEL